MIFFYFIKIISKALEKTIFLKIKIFIGKKMHYFVKISIYLWYDPVFDTFFDDKSRKG